MTVRRRRSARLLTVFAGLLLTAVGAVACEPAPADVETDARTAVERYVAAVAAGDLRTATAMTHPQALLPPRHADQPRAIDVTDALPNAKETAHDPWVAHLTGGYINLPASRSHPAVHLESIIFRVSFRVGPATGDDTVAVSQDAEHGWMVVDPLLEESQLRVDNKHLPTFTFGEVRIATKDTSTVWGYPGAYAAKGVDVPKGYRVEPVTFHLGSGFDRPWDEPDQGLAAVPTDSDDG